MKKLFLLNAFIVMLLIASTTNAMSQTNPNTVWSYDCSAAPVFHSTGATDPANGTMAWENGIWKINTIGKTFYPRITFPVTNITANRSLNIRMKCTSDEYVFLKAEIRTLRMYSVSTPSGANVYKEIDSEGNWNNINIQFDGDLTNYAIDSIAYLTLSFRNGADKFITCAAEIDEIVLGGDLTGIKENKLENVKVFPAITHDVLYFSAPVGREVTVEAFSITGVKVLNQTIKDFNGNAPVNVQHLQSGSYILNLTVDGKRSVNRFIKQ